MSSQEDYLDSLLNNLSTQEKTEDGDITMQEMGDFDADDIDSILQSVVNETPEEEIGFSETEDERAYPDAEDLFYVTNTENEEGELQDIFEEDIERLLAAGSASTQENNAEDDTVEDDSMDDVLGMLGETDDSDLQEIHELLQKSDNNETIAENIELFSEQAVAQELLGASSKKEKKADRKAAKEARAAAKKAEKDAKREAKKAKKAQKSLEKAQKTAQKENNESAQAEETYASNNDEGSLDADTLSMLDQVLSPAEEGSGENTESPNLLEGLGDLGLGDLSQIASAFPEEGAVTFDEADAEELLSIPDLDEIENQANGGRKKAFFSKLIEFFTEEDGEESDEGAVKLSDENKDILKEMDKEDRKKAKKSKKSGKKNKEGAKSEEGGEEGQAPQNTKKAKKKAKKEKKVKKNDSADVESKINEKKLSFKKILPIGLVCLSFGLAVIILSVISSDFVSKREGHAAYYAGDYQTCYQNLFGKNLNESEQVMYYKSESILRIGLRVKEYEIYANEGSQAEALDVLIQTVMDYPLLYEQADAWNATAEVEQVYGEILGILSAQYGLTEEQAREIGSLPDDVEYTKAVTDIAGGMVYGSSQADTAEEVSKEETLPDSLPEEEEISPEDAFIDNNPQ